MNPVKVAIFSFIMLSVIALGGLGIYGADASSGYAAIDGYGVTASR